MNDTETAAPRRYSGVAQTIHWVTAVLVLIAFTFGPGGSELRVYSPARDFDRQLHETLGLTVFALVMLRVLWWRFESRPPAVPAARWMSLAAKAVQGLLYLLLFAVPVSAISGAWLEGHPLTLLAGVRIQPLLALSHDTGAIIAQIHTWLGDAILWLAGLHAVAALYHHFYVWDDVLVSYFPHFEIRLSAIYSRAVL